MKKILVLLSLVLLTTMGVSAQQEKVNYQGYASVGSTLSSGHLSHGAELGVYSKKTWYAVGASATEVNNTVKWTASVKAYYKIGHQGFVDNYVWTAVNVGIYAGKPITFEPGVAAVFNVSDHFAPQVTLSFPVGENTNSIFKPLQMNVGVGINYWF